MEISQYQRFAEIDDRHWWFVARRKIVASLLKQYFNEQKAPFHILDIGTGSGGMIPLLLRHGHLVASEPDEQTLRLTREKYAEFSPAVEFIHGSWENLNLDDERFDLLTAFDVLEHCPDDRVALRQWRKWLKPDGRLFLTVPAFACLWGRNDELSRHYRRYTKATLLQALTEASFTVQKISYMNALMFLPVWVSRNIKDRIERLVAGSNEAPEPWDFGMPPPIVNSCLEKLFSSESPFLQRASLPFGTSLICLAQVTADLPDLR